MDVLELDRCREVLVFLLNRYSIEDKIFFCFVFGAFFVFGSSGPWLHIREGASYSALLLSLSNGIG